MPDTHRGLCSCWLKGGAGTWPVGGNTNRKFKEWLCEIVSQAGKLARDTGGVLRTQELAVIPRAKFRVKNGPKAVP